MSAPPDIEHDIADHLCRWSRTGCNSARLDRSRRVRRAAFEQPSAINLVAVIGLAPPFVSPGLPEPRQHRRRSVIAASGAATKSP